MLRWPFPKFSNLHTILGALNFWELSTHVNFGLERTIYPYDPPELLGIMAKKVLNLDSIHDESDVSSAWYGFLEGLRWNKHLPSTLFSHTDFPKFVHQKEKVKLNWVTCITSLSGHHATFWARGRLCVIFLRNGGLIAFVRVSSERYNEALM